MLVRKFILEIYFLGTNSVDTCKIKIYNKNNSFPNNEEAIFLHKYSTILR